MKELTIGCECHSFEHQFTLMYDDEGYFYLVTHLSAHGFFHRLKVALRFVLGYRSRYGDWDEVIVGYREVKRIRDFVEGYLVLR